MIEDQRVGDNSVNRTLFICELRLSHTIADHLAAAEFYLLAIGREVFLHLDDEIGVGEPHPVAGGRTKHVGLGCALNFH